MDPNKTAQEYADDIVATAKKRSGGNTTANRRFVYTQWRAMARRAGVPDDVQQQVAAIVNPHK